ncbi:aldehyde oxidoreductase [candidate division MSBL1 archaeon SCGC-AAA833K04]|uniref:Aldehyde oxidoreductase n=1 Tax=candidate division MSBL1 archaeon SCGC-AAA833K04 TaxID=1698258 RepID=A0A133VSR7_9EURY|nr:aldehyde oxidoreductase [candidate division MSBL1 archaeon SCGC-AAA833K04]
MEHVTVKNVEIPALGLGTYRLKGSTCVFAVKEALGMGYRHIDTAESYGNHREVGRAILESGVDREEIFLTTKVWKTNLAYEMVLESGDKSLRELGLDYVDLLLIHWPSSMVPVAETLEAMNRLREEGKVRHIGVSNFSVGQMKDAIKSSEIPILTNQVKYNPYHPQDKILEFCAENDIMLTAYTPLAKGRVVDNEVLSRIGRRYGKTPAQVTLRWLLQQDGVSAIPKASSKDHLRENFDIFDFELTDDEMRKVFELRGGIIDRIVSKFSF